jgi:hypothetical protein
MKASVLGIALAAVLLFPNANGQEMTQLSCKDFVPTEEARQRFPDLAGACDGVVERDGELFGLFHAEVRRVRGGRVTLHLPATDHTFTVKPDPSLRVLIDGRNRRPIIRLPSSRIPRYVY